MSGPTTFKKGRESDADTLESTASPGVDAGTKTPDEEQRKVSRRIEPSIRVFPNSSIRKVLELEMKESRTVERVSAEALLVLHDLLLKEGRKLARRSIEYTVKGKRKTISPDDVKRAIADLVY